MFYASRRHSLESLLSRVTSLAAALLLLGAVSVNQGADGPDGADPWISPAALALSLDGKTAYVASATSKEVLFVNLASGQVWHRVALPGEASGLALSGDGKLLLATSAASESQFVVIDVQAKSVLWSIPVGHTALAPILAADGATAYVCNRFSGSISVIDLHEKKETRRIPVEREPVAAALTRDGKYLLVANHLPVGRADLGMVSAHVSVVDLSAGKVIRQIALPNGANLLRSVAISPDGRWACVTHTLARFYLPTTQVERGWMNANAFTLIDTADWSLFSSVLLDAPEKGCANPWGAEWTADGDALVIAHAGTHEVSLINFPGLLAKINALPTRRIVKAGRLGDVVSQLKSDVSQDLGFLRELRKVVRLKGNGPRALAIRDHRICVGIYFSESLEVIDLKQTPLESAEVLLHPRRSWTEARKGEALFNDARICLQTWQSCASCHSSEARADGLNWDLINDGVGNPKNTKSLLRSHVTAPAMSTGVRETAETAVRAGIQHILFMAQAEATPLAMDAWLKGLDPVASPFLVCGQLSPAAARGKEIFQKGDTGCANCHSSTYLTDRKAYDVGTAAATDEKGMTFDTPILLELWRTAPYLHDGSAATLRDVVSDRNRGDQHGRTSHLSESQIKDLVEYLLSL